MYKTSLMDAVDGLSSVLSFLECISPTITGTVKYRSSSRGVGSKLSETDRTYTNIQIGDSRKDSSPIKMLIRKE
jgi:hypothetical protein